MQAVRLPLYAAISVIGYIVASLSFLDPLIRHVALTVCFMIVIGFEKRHACHPFFTLPPAVFSFYCFINIFASGLIYFAFELQNETQILVQDQTIVRGSWYTLVAVEALWVAFYFFPDARIKLFGEGRIYSVPRKVIIILTGLALLSFAVGVNTGMYGYSADEEQVDWLSYIRFGVNLGLLAIILLVAYEYQNREARVLLWLLVSLNIFFGLAYGSKSTAIIPIVLVIITLYFTGKRVPTSYWAAVGVTLIIAYTVVEPFRVYYDATGRTQNLSNIEELVSTYIAANKAAEGHEVDYVSAFFERNSYVTVLARTIEFADTAEYYRTEEWGDLALSPLYAIIPRFLWQSKPQSNFGSWASVNIFGFAETTSTGITPQGYAYLVMRLGGILIFFAVAGVIQRLMFNLLYLNTGFVAFYVLLYLEIGYPAVVPSTYIAGTIKSMIFIAPLMAWLMYLNRQQMAGRRGIL